MKLQARGFGICTCLQSSGLKGGKNGLQSLGSKSRSRVSSLMLSYITGLGFSTRGGGSWLGVLRNNILNLLRGGVGIKATVDSKNPVWPWNSIMP